MICCRVTKGAEGTPVVAAGGNIFAEEIFAFLVGVFSAETREMMYHYNNDTLPVHTSHIIRPFIPNEGIIRNRAIAS